MSDRFNTKFGCISPADFLPPPWLKNAHLQTILPKYMLPAPNINYVMERVATPDNDFVDLAWSMPNKVQTTKAIVVLFHGLEGSCESHYIKHVIQALNEFGFGTVVMHFRGCSTELNMQAIAYHSGATFDPKFIVPIIKERYSHLPLFAVGFSLGGNMLMKLMAHSADLPIEASVCISAPLDLAASSATIQVGFSKLYQWHLMKSMKANIIQKMQTIDMTGHLKVSPSDIIDMTTFEQFDEHITAVLHGFLGAEDYYAKCSALQDLPLIDKPTLIIHAKDDPFMNVDVIPRQSHISKHIAYELSTNGGHVGFLNGLSGANRLWLPQRITDFFGDVL